MPTFAPTIQALLSGALAFPPTGAVSAVDWPMGWIIAPANNGNVARIAIVGGAELAHSAITGWPNALNNPIGLDLNGHFYLVDPIGNYGGIGQYDEISLAR